MLIRQMKKEEIDEIGRIYALSWKSAYQGIVPQDYLDEITEKRWSFLADNPRKSYVLIDEDKLIGTSSVDPGRDESMSHWGEIISIYLLPESFGKGYGKLLLDFSVNELRSRGFNKIYLWTLEQNYRARSFYEKNGFLHDGATMLCEVGGEKLTEVRYILCLQ